MTKEQLIQALENATEGSRELDLEITKAIGSAPPDAEWSTREEENLPEAFKGSWLSRKEWETPEYRADRQSRREATKALIGENAEKISAWFDANPFREWDWKNAPPAGTVPRYTTSLDAAMTMVPEGWRVHFAGQTASTDWFFELIERNGPGRGERIWAKSAALALTIAALKARPA